MIRVCLVDDQNLVRQGIRSLLELVDDIEVIAEASDGVEALPAIRESQPDVVLLDVTLPGMRALEVLDELRRIRAGVKVVICTAYSRETAMAELGGRRVDGFIRKPYRSADLVQLLSQFAA